MGTFFLFQTTLPELDIEESIWIQSEEVLNTKERQLRQYTIKEVLIYWKDTSQTYTNS